MGDQTLDVVFLAGQVAHQREAALAVEREAAEHGGKLPQSIERIQQRQHRRARLGGAEGKLRRLQRNDQRTQSAR